MQHLHRFDPNFRRKKQKAEHDERERVLRLFRLQRERLQDVRRAGFADILGEQYVAGFRAALDTLEPKIRDGHQR